MQTTKSRRSGALNLGPKMDVREQEVVAAVLGVSNLGLDFCIWGHGRVPSKSPPTRDALRVLGRQDTSDGYCFSLTQSVAESDDMMEGFQDEVAGWRKNVRGWTRAYVAATWPDVGALLDHVLPLHDGRLYKVGSHFRQETGLGARPGVCGECRAPFDDHYNGQCPLDEG